jgi:hypothetical protein
MDKATSNRVQELIELYRQRLHDLSWFMRCLNESIARMANKEDGCKGRFWEGRFRSQALLDERALLTCMAYVDLNPIRAAIATSPEQSEYTSIKERIDHPASNLLRKFSGTTDDRLGIPYELKDYLQLLDWAGRAVLQGKRGNISPSVPPILNRLSIYPDEMLHFLANRQDYPKAIGAVEKIQNLARSLGGSFFKGTLVSRRLWPVLAR